MERFKKRTLLRINTNVRQQEESWDIRRQNSSCSIAVWQGRCCCGLFGWMDGWVMCVLCVCDCELTAASPLRSTQCPRTRRLGTSAAAVCCYFIAQVEYVKNPNLHSTHHPTSVRRRRTLTSYGDGSVRCDASHIDTLAHSICTIFCLANGTSS